ncbi:hypothetical protein G647_09018 [Cladophialophora carrionii CBS 160.54]|uniref:Uncharacterized protein n=1 Tax=Cladophialophora carrionii CBS 160.54 TaxID=1279043 RepID=V9D151_9EURO|nr:uncharacterized protein G647_09018 [Cladophialophora carrionii CBS 160.54]ETI20003.1 hypothetical protein G647_09018 [Cladophialophora carrionii CBS 160.54]
MPRITPLRILLLIPVFYAVLVLLWAALPSPEVPWGTDIVGKAAEHLWRGGTITRVYDVDDFFPHADSSPYVQTARRSQRLSFALDFAYNASSRRLAISGYYDTQVWNVSMLLEVASYQDDNVYLTESFGVDVKTGDHDGINLPWFTPADATLLFWEIHEEVVPVPLRLRAHGDRNIQVLPDSEVWEHAEFASRQQSTVPLLSLVVDPTDPERELQHAIWPSGDVAPNSSPSSTFMARRAILRILLPSWSLVADVLMPRVGRLIVLLATAVSLAFWVFVVYAAVVLACWKASGMTDFWPWARTFWMTRRVVSYLGAKISPARDPAEGKVVVDESEGAETIDEVARTGPTPLTSPWAFFTSSSPLDDLFVTFEATKPLVQPLGRSGMRRRRTGDLEGQVESTASTSSASKEANGEIATGESPAPPP